MDSAQLASPPANLSMNTWNVCVLPTRYATPHSLRSIGHMARFASLQSCNLAPLPPGGWHISKSENRNPRLRTCETHTLPTELIPRKMHIRTDIYFSHLFFGWRCWRRKRIRPLSRTHLPPKYLLPPPNLFGEFYPLGIGFLVTHVDS